MSEMKGKARKRQWMTAGALALAGLLAGPLANAETVLVKDAPLISGTQSYVYSITAPSAGSFSVQMKDLNFPAALSDLSFAVAGASGVLGKLEGVGAMDFDVSGPGNYFAIVFGKSAGRLDVGQLWFSLAFAPLVDPAPVPLPGAAFLLLSGLAGVVGLKKKRAA